MIAILCNQARSNIFFKFELLDGGEDAILLSKILDWWDTANVYTRFSLTNSFVYYFKMELMVNGPLLVHKAFSEYNDLKIIDWENHNGPTCIYKIYNRSVELIRGDMGFIVEITKMQSVFKQIDGLTD